MLLFFNPFELKSYFQIQKITDWSMIGIDLNKMMNWFANNIPPFPIAQHSHLRMGSIMDNQSIRLNIAGQWISLKRQNFVVIRFFTDVKINFTALIWIWWVSKVAFLKLRWNTLKSKKLMIFSFEIKQVNRNKCVVFLF